MVHIVVESVTKLVRITRFQSVLEGKSFAGVSLVGVKDQFYCLVAIEEILRGSFTAMPADFIPVPHGRYACNLNVIRLTIMAVCQIKFDELSNNFKAWRCFNCPLAMKVRRVTPRKSYKERLPKLTSFRCPK